MKVPENWWQPFWSDIRGVSTKNGHPAPYPVELAGRLIRMFSFAGDTVFDPFLGIGTTSIASLIFGRNSIGSEIEPTYLEISKKLMHKTKESRKHGPLISTVLIDGNEASRIA